jgi:branched-chain amino acid aminotransferase
LTIFLITSIIIYRKYFISKKRLLVMEKITIELNPNPKAKPEDESKLGFGHLFTDHMFIMDYKDGKGWYNPRIVPFGPLTLSPATMCLHYGQEVFEGLKAYRTADGKIQLFRPDENFKRLNVSNERLVIPAIDEEFALHALNELVKVDKDWVPHTDGASLYIRPFIISVDPYLGVRPASEYMFIIIMSPSGAYYSSGLDPVSIYVESNYVRAVKGGMGFTKTAGNYAASLIAQNEAHEQDYSQVLWLDGVEKKYIEEVGAMNIFFKIDGEIITPALHGSILSGITRKSAIELCKSWGMKVSEKRITIQEVAEAYDNGKLEEVFGTGTAAVISPVGRLKWQDKVMIINDNKIGEVSQKLYDTMTGIQYGKIKDEFGWIREVK